MKQSRKHKEFYFIGALLSFLLLKLVLTVFFACSREDPLPICFQSQTAVAAESSEQEETETNSVESSLKKGAQESQEDDTSSAVVEKKFFELEMERRSIQREREQLLILQTEIEEKLIELSKLQEKIKETVDKKSEAHEQKIKHLIKVYTSMAPKKAAGLIEQLDINIIVELFSKMKGDSVGKILSNVKPEKAAVISARLLKR
jgi:flagellar motility protein MotE (MotC chaperone)